MTITNKQVVDFIKEHIVSVFCVLHSDSNVNKEVKSDLIKQTTVDQLKKELDQRECFDSHIIKYVQQNQHIFTQNDVDFVNNIKDKNFITIQFDDVGDYIILM
jgi:hypothetical protein